MSNQENNDDDDTSNNIKSILFVIGGVAIFVAAWILLQSVISVPMKMV